jgi:signal transduction histidine kinase/DNA-binding response OmpR family regulator
MNNRMNAGQTSVVDFKSDFRISTTPLLAMLALIGIAIIYLAYLPEYLLNRLFILAIGCLLLALVPAVVWMERHKWPFDRWLLILGLAGSVHVMSFLVGIQTSLILTPLTIALGAAVLGFRLASGLAALQTVVILLLPTALGVEVPIPITIVGVMAIWISFATMIAVYYPVRRVGQWIGEYYLQSRHLADETQQRREEYERLVKDLAHANLQLTRLNAIAQAMRQTAESARTAKEQFVANVSHELRTPLNMIIGFSEMVLHSPETYGARIPPALQADLAVIHRNAEHLTKLIDDVLDLSQIEAGQMALTKEQVQFAEIINSATHAVRPLYEAKGLYLEVEMPGRLPVVFCDPTRIREVLLNLLSNAGRFTEHGGVRVHVQYDNDKVTVSVSDTGHGISSKDMDKLFQPFQQLDSTIRRAYGGTGLGLSISKLFVELHGGTISVDSEPGTGTTFTFQVPIIPPGPLSGDSTRWLNPDWTYLQRVDPPSAPKPVMRSRLLVLESGLVLQRLLARYLEDVEIVPVPSVEQAIDELQRTPALALIVNNTSITKELDLLKSSMRLTNGLPVLICSVPDPHDATASMGVADILVKPIAQDTLLGALYRLKITEGTVLIVDDEPDVLHLFGRMLTSSNPGYRVLQAGDGVEAMSILKEFRPDVILLDLVMPNMDGYQMLSMLRESPAHRDIPVIIISARDPLGQPIMSTAMTIMREGGISIRQLLACITATTSILSGGQAAELTLREDPNA